MEKNGVLGKWADAADRLWSILTYFLRDMINFQPYFFATART